MITTSTTIIITTTTTTTVSAYSRKIVLIYITVRDNFYVTNFTCSWKRVYVAYVDLLKTYQQYTSINLEKKANYQYLFVTLVMT